MRIERSPAPDAGDGVPVVLYKLHDADYQRHEIQPDPEYAQVVRDSRNKWGQSYPDYQKQYWRNFAEQADRNRRQQPLPNGYLDYLRHRFRSTVPDQSNDVQKKTFSDDR